jgi:hypothetical protein
MCVPFNNIEVVSVIALLYDALTNLHLETVGTRKFHLLKHSPGLTHAATAYKTAGVGQNYAKLFSFPHIL